MTGSAESPQLDPARLRQLAAFGVAQQVRVRDVVFRPGDAAYDLILIESGRIQIVDPAGGNEPEAVLAEYGPGGFLGELNLLTGGTTVLAARVVEAGTIHRIARDQFRRLMEADAELADILLRAFLARRDGLRSSSPARLLEIVGSGTSAAGRALRTYAARQGLPHLWLDADSLAGRALIRLAPLSVADLPAVVTPDRLLRRATPAELAAVSGRAYRAPDGPAADLVVIGAGPAGLAATVHGAAEGLAVAVVDRVGAGGSASVHDRIEDYAGLPAGATGRDVIRRALDQATDLGARLVAPARVVGLDWTQDTVQVVLADGTRLQAPAVLIASGAAYRTLPLPRWTEFVRRGIHYAATEPELRAYEGAPVAVVGGTDPAGRAALALAGRAGAVTLVVRGRDLHDRMAAYLADRVLDHPGVTVRTATEVTSLDGRDRLARIQLTDTTSGVRRFQPCRALFCFLGARPAVDFATGVALDGHGFVRTDVQLAPSTLDPIWSTLERFPLSYESSVPGVFAAGDVRAGSTKRITAAVGEGVSVVRSIRTAVGSRW